jgi:hypothetical protein
VSIKLKYCFKTVNILTAVTASSRFRKIHDGIKMDLPEKLQVIQTVSYTHTHTERLEDSHSLCNYSICSANAVSGYLSARNCLQFLVLYWSPLPYALLIGFTLTRIQHGPVSFARFVKSVQFWSHFFLANGIVQCLTLECPNWAHNEELFFVSPAAIGNVRSNVAVGTQNETSGANWIVTLASHSVCPTSERKQMISQA